MYAIYLVAASANLRIWFAGQYADCCVLCCRWLVLWCGEKAARHVHEEHAYVVSLKEKQKLLPKLLPNLASTS